jgi:exopolysaccharide biosynthesis protein
VPFDAPWNGSRSCVHAFGGAARIAPRNELADDPSGDLLQAGPMLVRHGRTIVRDGHDPEGFSSGARQFDSDITVGRYPRAALGLTPDRVIVVACDGRAADDAGLSLPELADLLVELGAVEAINLDGGGSTSLVCGGRLRNRPRSEFGRELPGGRPVRTALVLRPRS